MKPKVKPGKVMRLKERGLDRRKIERKTGATKKEVLRAERRARDA